MARDIPVGWRIREMLPVRGRLQQYRLQAGVTFRCSRCGRDTTTQTVATLDWDWSAPMCEGCHGMLSTTKDAEPVGPIVPEPWKPSVPESQKPRAGETVAALPPGKPQKREGPQGSPGKLRMDFTQLAAILRDHAAGAKLNPEKRRALKVLADDLVFPVALRYAELLDEGDAMVGRHSGKAVPTHARALARQRVDAVRRFEDRYAQRIAHVRSTSSVPDRLSRLVVREVAREKYDRAFASVLRQRGMRPEAISLPTVRLWSWLTLTPGDPTPSAVALPRRSVGFLTCMTRPSCRPSSPMQRALGLRLRSNIRLLWSVGRRAVARSSLGSGQPVTIATGRCEGRWRRISEAGRLPGCAPPHVPTRWRRPVA